MKRGLTARGMATRRKALSVQAVITAPGEYEIARADDWHGYTAEPAGPATPRPEDGAIARLVKMLEADCRRWFSILARCPLPNDYIVLKRSGQGARWLTMAMEKADQFHGPMQAGKKGRAVASIADAPVKRRPPLTRAEISWMDQMSDVLFTLQPRSLEWFLIFGRAQRKTWDEIGAYDIQRRQERQLRNLYNDALTHLLPVYLRVIHKI